MNGFIAGQANMGADGHLLAEAGRAAPGLLATGCLTHRPGRASVPRTSASASSWGPSIRQSRSAARPGGFADFVSALACAGSRPRRADLGCGMTRGRGFQEVGGLAREGLALHGEAASSRRTRYCPLRLIPLFPRRRVSIRHLRPIMPRVIDMNAGNVCEVQEVSAVRLARRCAAHRAGGEGGMGVVRWESGDARVNGSQMREGRSRFC